MTAPRAQDHERLHACVHGWVVRLRLVECESRRQAALLVATGRAPPCVVLHFFNDRSAMALLSAARSTSPPPILEADFRTGRGGVAQLGVSRHDGRPFVVCASSRSLGGFRSRLLLPLRLPLRSSRRLLRVVRYTPDL